MSEMAVALGGRHEVDGLSVRALAAVTRRLRLDGAWLHTTDPATYAWTSYACTHDDVVRPFIENEFLTDDFAKFAQLAQRGAPVAVLSRETGGELERSARYRQLLKPIGLEHELRIPLLAGGSCWGGICAVRGEDRQDFKPAEAAMLAELAGEIALQVRAAAWRPAPRSLRDDVMPGTIILDAANSAVSISAEADHWLRLLGGSERSLPVAVHVVSAQARARARGADGPAPSAALRGLDGRWVELHGSALRSRATVRADAFATGIRPPSDVAIMIGAAQPRTLMPLLIDAFELSARERDVLTLMLRGASVDEIARELVISLHTVRDHVKAIYAKAGVTSRPELSARLLAIRLQTQSD